MDPIQAFGQPAHELDFLLYYAAGATTRATLASRSSPILPPGFRPQRWCMVTRYGPQTCGKA